MPNEWQLVQGVNICRRRIEYILHVVSFSNLCSLICFRRGHCLISLVCLINFALWKGLNLGYKKIQYCVSYFMFVNSKWVVAYGQKRKTPIYHSVKLIKKRLDSKKNLESMVFKKEEVNISPVTVLDKGWTRADGVHASDPCHCATSASLVKLIGSEATDYFFLFFKKESSSKKKAEFLTFPLLDT